MPVSRGTRVCHVSHGYCTLPHVNGIQKFVVAAMKIALPSQSTRLSFSTMEPGTRLSFIDHEQSDYGKGNVNPEQPSLE